MKKKNKTRCTFWLSTKGGWWLPSTLSTSSEDSIKFRPPHVPNPQSIAAIHLQYSAQNLKIGTRNIDQYSSQQAHVYKVLKKGLYFLRMYSTHFNYQICPLTKCPNNIFCWGTGYFIVIAVGDALWGSHACQYKFQLFFSQEVRIISKKVCILSKIPVFTRVFLEAFYILCCNSCKSLIGSQYIIVFRRARVARRHLNRSFGRQWIGRRGPVNWPARSPNLNPPDFQLWWHLNTVVYSEPNNDLELLQQRVYKVVIGIFVLNHEFLKMFAFVCDKNLEVVLTSVGDTQSIWRRDYTKLARSLRCGFFSTLYNGSRLKPEISLRSVTKGNKWIVKFDNWISCEWILHTSKICNNFFINPVQKMREMKFNVSNWRVKKTIEEMVTFLSSTTEIKTKNNHNYCQKICK